MQRIYLKDRSFAIDSLPSESALLVELMELCSDNEATFEMFAAAIRKDAALTAQFLRLANSPLYRQWNEVTDLKRMLIVLGMQNVRKIIITSAVQNFFSSLSSKNDYQTYQFWLRALLCAHLAEELANRTGYLKPGEAYLSGLLHQIGILLLRANYQENYCEILEQYEECPDFRQLERDNYGLDHCEVGAALVESWQLDSLMADAILFQFCPTEELQNSPALLKIVAVARGLASPPNIEAHEQDIQRAGQLLQLSQDATLECLAQALDDSREILERFGFRMDDNLAEKENREETRQVRQQQTAKLAEQVKNISLTYCFMNGQAQDNDNLVKELRINCDLLFNQKQLVLLTKKGQRLLPFNDLKTAKLDAISFSLEDQHSVIVQSFIGRRVLDSVSKIGSIADNQIIRVLNAECAVFFPLCHGNETLGVLVIGSKRKELAAIKEKQALLQLLLDEISRKYAQLNGAEEAEPSISMTEFSKIIHEVKNPLTIINNYLYILGRKLDEDHAAKEEISFIKEEMERVTSILAKARDRDRQTAGAMQTDVNRLLDELDKFFANSLYREKAIRSSLELDSGIPILSCPENKLKQVFINIIKNAVEALPQAGEITISSRDNCFQNGNLFVEICLRDNGPGMPPQILRNLFRPVESTKQGHSGLGLSIVADLINEMSGTISCYSSQGRGTEFKILLPRLTPGDED